MNSPAKTISYRAGATELNWLRQVGISTGIREALSLKMQAEAKRVIVLTPEQFGVLKPQVSLPAHLERLSERWAEFEQGTIERSNRQMNESLQRLLGTLEATSEQRRKLEAKSLENNQKTIAAMIRDQTTKQANQEAALVVMFGSLIIVSLLSAVLLVRVLA